MSASLNNYEILLKNMSGTMMRGRLEYLPKENAYEQLKRWTGQDFGFDLEGWMSWINENVGRSVNGLTVRRVRKVW